MMNYEEFKKVVAERILDYILTEGWSYKAEIRPVTKVNCTFDGLNLVPPTMLPPTISMDGLYEYYKKCNSLEVVLRKAAEIIKKGYEQMSDISFYPILDRVKNHIIMQLINTEQNKELLEHLPHRKMKDLSIIYRWLVDVDREGIASAMISYNLLKRLDMSEKQLFSLAKVNTLRLFPPVIRSMHEIVEDMFWNDEEKEEMIGMVTTESNQDKAMYVITNQRGLHGAILMAYDEVLQQVAEKMHSDFYILPSSVHELIAVSAHMCDPNELARMVYEVNQSQVALNERLSYQVYHYDKDLRKLSFATDTPYTRLDGTTAYRFFL
ncbi:DUF5688 family protein [Anaerocolumna xylanovorans]|uniref:Uncharacterized protein n=1 Tax=Anaerocolumna xylanovorans DSM 12503 TaxID=1121345 RepID=A0A1M7YNL6_9FIRM|nr:DUF5688 family protein [Anaerocolumna xylanovorans]SHO54158.1 hypothetical protein SAMN02745217_04613 [Anaerocolumna xylanovorans DSM 12503]